MAIEVHGTAIIGKNVELEEDVYIGPYSVLEGKVTIGRGSRILSNVVIEGVTTIGSNCTIHPFATIGLPPQDTKYKGEETSVRIGDGNVIREYISIHRGSVGAEGVTSIGDNNFLMAYVHVAHDCKLGSRITIANSVGLSGHVEVGDGAVIGGMAGVHQHTRIGAYAMVGGMSRISQDIVPYVIASGFDLKLYGINNVGLKRNGFSEETVNELKKAYKMLFREKLSLQDAIKKVQEELPYSDEIKLLIDFIQKNKRGICRSAGTEA